MSKTHPKESKVPKVEPIQVQEFTVKQSKYEVCGKLPIRSVILGPSGSGKTVLLRNMILDIYRDCFSRIFIFSPSVEVDMTWGPVKKYIENHMKVMHTAEEPIYFDHYDPEALANILETQHKITTFLKKRGDTKLFQILIIIDDFADDPSFTRQSKLLHALYTRRAQQHDLDHNCDAKVQRYPPHHQGQRDRASCSSAKEHKGFRHIRRGG